MARPIVLSNGRLHVGINNYGLVHDLFYPYVGLENQANGDQTRHRIGVWENGSISWLDQDDEWQFSFRYPHNALIGKITARHESRGILLEFDDVVDSFEDIFVRNIHVVNLREDARELRIFMHQAFVIGDSRSYTDTAQYLPHSHAIMHYRGHRTFIIGGLHDGQPFDQYSIGLFGIEGREGTWRDAEDGELSMGNVEHGQVDSVLRFTLNLEGHSSSRLHYWISASTSRRLAIDGDKKIRHTGPSRYVERTAKWWQDWFSPAMKVVDALPKAHQRRFIESLMIIKSQMDSRGAIMASTDSAMLKQSRDAYAYSWPRDAGYILWPLIRLGYYDEPLNYFNFSQKNMHPTGYMDHKYRADGSLGPSWHPYVHGSVIAPPIQEDETAITVFMFHQFYEKNRSKELLNSFYLSMIKPMAQFMAQYTDHTTGLPRPSYDLWEEKFLISTYTTATVYGALLAAAHLAEIYGDESSAVSWRLAADDIQTAAHKYLFNKDRSAFYKGLLAHDDGSIEYDDTIDASSLYGAFMYGLFAEQSDEIQAAIKTHDETFGFSKDTPGLPRYEEDNYRRIDFDVTGNWWPIGSLWRAQLAITQRDEATALTVVDWVRDGATDSGVMTEQIRPQDGQFMSVAPLTWTHAEYVSTLLDMQSEAS